jgi:CheY-like chemotaxis protein
MDHRPHIVVVEDEATQRQLLVDYLDKQNFRVSAADASGPSPSRQRARSPALPACSSAAAAVPTPLAPMAWAAPLSL